MRDPVDKFPACAMLKRDTESKEFPSARKTCSLQQTTGGSKEPAPCVVWSTTCFLVHKRKERIFNGMRSGQYKRWDPDRIPPKRTAVIYRELRQWHASKAKALQPAKISSESFLCAANLPAQGTFLTATPGLPAREAQASLHASFDQPPKGERGKTYTVLAPMTPVSSTSPRRRTVFLALGKPCPYFTNPPVSHRIP